MSTAARKAQVAFCSQSADKAMGEVRLAKKAVQSRGDHSRNTDGRNRQGRPHYGGRKILLGLAAWEGFPNREGVSSMRYSQEEW